MLEIEKLSLYISEKKRTKRAPELGTITNKTRWKIFLKS